MHNKRDATVLEKLKTLSVEDIILDEMKTQILSVAGVDYACLREKLKTLSVEDIILDEMKTQILSVAGVDYACLRRYDCILVEKWG